MIKMFNKLGIEETHFNMIKASSDKPTANSILRDARLKAFPLRSGTRQGCSLSPFLFNNFLQQEVLVKAIRQGKEINCNQIRKEQAKLPL